MKDQTKDNDNKEKSIMLEEISSEIGDIKQYQMPHEKKDTAKGWNS